MPIAIFCLGATLTLGGLLSFFVLIAGLEIKYSRETVVEGITGATVMTLLGILLLYIVIG